MKHTRTIREAASWFKGRDPDTALTETAIRTLVKQNRIPHARIGNRDLVTLEALEEYIAGSYVRASTQPKADREQVIE